MAHRKFPPYKLLDVVCDLCNHRDVARKTDRFTVELRPISGALWYTGSANTEDSLRRKGKR